MIDNNLPLDASSDEHANDTVDNETSIEASVTGLSPSEQQAVIDHLSPNEIEETENGLTVSTDLQDLFPTTAVDTETLPRNEHQKQQDAGIIHPTGTKHSGDFDYWSQPASIYEDVIKPYHHSLLHY